MSIFVTFILRHWETDIVRPLPLHFYLNVLTDLSSDYLSLVVDFRRWFLKDYIVKNMLIARLFLSVDLILQGMIPSPSWCCIFTFNLFYL